MNLSRRELLASFLGMPFALAACRSAPARPIEGQIVGATVAAGHRIRSGERPEPASDGWRDTDVVIVGGGAAGLSAAWRLKKAGMERFELLELEPEVGGTALSGHNAVSAYPWGAHYLPVPLSNNHSLIALLKEMSLIEGVDATGSPIVSEEHLVRDPEERIYWHGYWYEGLFPHQGASPRDLEHFHAFMEDVNRWVAWRDGKGRRAFCLPVSQCSDDPMVTELDRITFHDYVMKRGWSSWRLKWLLDYACRDDYGTRIEHTSAWSGLFYFASRVPEPGKTSAELMTWPEGNGRLIHWLRDHNARHLKTGALVTEIVPADDKGLLEVRYLDLASQKAMGIRCRQVVYAAPLFLARHLIRSFRESPPPWTAAFDHSPWAVANLTLNGRPKQLGYPLCWDNVLIDSPSLGYVDATHQSLHDHGPTVWTWYYPLTGENVKTERNRLLSTDWKGWMDVAVSDLKRAHPDLEKFVERVDIMRWGHAMIRPTPGIMWGGERLAAHAPHRGIRFAHTDLSGMALFEEAHDHGVRVAEEVLAALGVTAPSIR